MSQGMVLGSVFTRLRNLVSRRELVGRDAFGNTFYRKVEKDLSGNETERRTMEAPNNGNHTSYNPKAVASQWRQWLSKTRRDPPTEEELQAEIMRQSQLQVRVAQINAEEQRRRMQAQAAGEEAEAAEGPNLDRFVGQLTGKGYAADAQNSSSKTGKGDDFEPEAWRPGT